MQLWVIPDRWPSGKLTVDITCPAFQNYFMKMSYDSCPWGNCLKRLDLKNLGLYNWYTQCNLHTLKSKQKEICKVGRKISIDLVLKRACWILWVGWKKEEVSCLEVHFFVKKLIQFSNYGSAYDRHSNLDHDEKIYFLARNFFNIKNYSRTLPECSTELVVIHILFVFSDTPNFGNFFRVNKTEVTISSWILPAYIIWILIRVG